MLLHHAHGAFAYFWGKTIRFVHGSILSRIRASSKPGAIHGDRLAKLYQRISSYSEKFGITTTEENIKKLIEDAMRPVDSDLTSERYQDLLGIAFYGHKNAANIYQNDGDFNLASQYLDRVDRVVEQLSAESMFAKLEPSADAGRDFVKSQTVKAKRPRRMKNEYGMTISDVISKIAKAHPDETPKNLWTHLFHGIEAWAGDCEEITITPTNPTYKYPMAEDGKFKTIQYQTFRKHVRKVKNGI